MTLLDIHKQAKIRVERPELFEAIEVAAAESWLNTIKTEGGISVTKHPTDQHLAKSQAGQG